ncbi:hypothetical protein ES705_50813 [subsurface metagenome]
MKKPEKTLAIALETVGCCIIALGIGIEVVTEADLGYILITSGAFAVAFGGMLWAKFFRKG